MSIADRIASIYDRIESGPLNPVWISIIPRDQALARAKEIEAAGDLPLKGLTFAVKDNIDVAGLPTTAACKTFGITKAESATVVRRLEDAGAILIGKTNMDQFATGLVGTRSPYGACSSVYDGRYISGGSSSGSAVAVAKELVDFSLGTDTAGSGRVPAAFNNIIGLKPTRGIVSTTGVFPACRTLDCVSIFARDTAMAAKAYSVARGFDAADPFSRSMQPGDNATPWAYGPLRVGIPSDDQLQFFGDCEAANLYKAAVQRLGQLGAERVEIDFAPFRAAAALLYSGPWVAERLAAVEEFIASHGEDMDPVVRGIISGGNRYSAVDAFRSEYRLRELRRATEAIWRDIDVMMLPTTGTIYTHEAIAADPVRLNTNLGYYTNFVNLLDLSAIAVPAGFRPNGLPFGVSFIAPAFSDDGLLALAARYGSGRAPSELACPPGCVPIAVVGAHLEGQPLHWQVKDRGSRLMKSCRTAPGYRLYALDGTKPAKPGLVRDDAFSGPGIEVEVWAMPENHFGGFVAGVPAPLGIGNATLETGESVKCFICEPYAIAGAREVTSFGGWRNYLASLEVRN